MKSTPYLAAALICVSSLIGHAQDREPIYFESSHFGTPFSHSDTQVSMLLFRGAGLGYGDLVHTVCIPSFLPPWAVFMYHLGTYSPGPEEGLHIVGEDTLHFIVTSITTDRGLSIEGDSCFHRVLSANTTRRTRELPDSCARSVIRAFTTTIKLARWPKDEELTSIDGTTYHFGAKERGARTWQFRAPGTLRWAQSIDPPTGTRARELVQLSEALAGFVEAPSDSMAVIFLHDIRSKALDLISKH
jgi:hypothetical protein